MKKIVLLILATLFSVLTFSAEKGGEPDIIYFNVTMNDEVGVKNVVEGMSDIYLSSINASVYNGLSQVDKNKLDVYSVPSGSWSLFLNPVPNKAPYQVERAGVTEFNPFAIKEIRFALNFLINRQYVVDEILNGAGGVKFTQATEGLPNAWRIDLVAAKYGFTPEGNKEKAINIIENTMLEASLHPSNKGRLLKRNGFWHFDNRPVSIRFVIRVDDPNGRVRLGNYLAGLLEEAGIKADRLLWDMNRSNSTVYSSDPANLDWHLYTEGWGAGSTYVWWDVPTLQYHTVSGTFLPGRNTQGWWNFEFDNPRAKELDLQYREGRINSLDEHWSIMEELTALGLEDSVRIFLTYQNDYYVANKNRLKERLFYGLGNGLKKFAIENAKTNDGILRLTQLSRAGGTFTSEWDPVGSNGFRDVFSTAVSQLVFDREFIDTPFGTIAERRTKVLKTRSEPIFTINGGLSGNIDVDPKALRYNPISEKFEAVGENLKAAVETSYEINMGKWHHGREISINDYLYRIAFVSNWATKLSDNDRRFDNSYSTQVAPGMGTSLGFRIDGENKVTTWSLTNRPMGELDSASVGSLALTTSPPGKPGYGVPFELLEAFEALILEGSASGTRYGFTAREGIEPIDLKSQSFTRDLLAKLNELLNRRHIPKILKGRMSEKEILEGYRLAIKFIEEKGHGLIAYGAYYINKLDTRTGFVELRAFRDPAYTEERGKWASLLTKNYLRIDSIETPDFFIGGEELEILVNISNIEYPSNRARRAKEGEIKAIFILEDGSTKEFQGKKLRDGQFSINIPSNISQELIGEHTVVLSASLDGDFTGTNTIRIEIY